MSSFLSSFFPKASPTTLPGPPFPYTWQTNPYRCKRQWPPQFEKLDNKHKFSLERRFRRRTKLKWARPTWTKVTKLTQWGTILAVAVYGIFFMDPPVEPAKREA